VNDYHTSKYDCYLYDVNDSSSVKPKRQLTPKQLEAIERRKIKEQLKRDYQDWVEEIEWQEADRIAAVNWARKQINDNNWVVLDTETTGLFNSEIVEIAVVSASQDILLNTLVKPSISIPEETIEIHGIDDEMVKSSPSFIDIYPCLCELLTDKNVIIYNAAFDTKVINYCRNLHNLPPIKPKSVECCMLWYAQWYGEYSTYYGSYKWQTLNSSHRALEDCLSTIELIKKIASDSNEIKCPFSTEELQLLGVIK
jgi:DNA polymerase-3 subunit epsilon